MYLPELMNCPRIQLRVCNQPIREVEDGQAEVLGGLRGGLHDNLQSSYQDNFIVGVPRDRSSLLCSDGI